VTLRVEREDGVVADARDEEPVQFGRFIRAFAAPIFRHDWIVG
jgi:hypothetical protein